MSDLSENTARAVGLRRLNPFEEGPQSDREPRLLVLLPGNAATLMDNGKWIFQGVTDLTPLFSGSGLTNLWLFPDSDVAMLVRAVRDRNRQLIVNTIANPDQHGDVLRIAARICEHFPVLNAPDRILLHTREKVAAALQNIPGLDVPFCIRARAEKSAVALVPGYPAVLRRAGTVLGQTARLVQDTGDAAAFMAEHEGAEVYMIGFRDFRSSDGLYRKYQVFIIGGEPHPYHVHFGHSWISDARKSAALINSRPKLKAEEAEFLAGSFDARIRQIFREIDRRIGVDIFAIDYARGDDGTVIFFEANAHQSMNRLDVRAADVALRAADDKLVRAGRKCIARKILESRKL